MYSKLQNANKVFLDSRLGPTLSCLVAEKKINFQISYFSVTITNLAFWSSQDGERGSQGGEVKEVEVKES